MQNKQTAHDYSLLECITEETRVGAIVNTVSITDSGGGGGGGGGGRGGEERG